MTDRGAQARLLLRPYLDGTRLPSEYTDRELMDMSWVCTLGRDIDVGMVMVFHEELRSRESRRTQKIAHLSAFAALALAIAQVVIALSH